MKPFYMMLYTDYTGVTHTEWYDNTCEVWQRYEDLRASGSILKCAVYTKMVEFTPSKAE